MPTPPLLDFDALIAPIPGDNPAGAPLPNEVRQKLEEARQEVDPSNWPEDDPMRPPPKKADWATIVREAQETLTRKSKDLLVAARLTEALVCQQSSAGLTKGAHQGFAGLRDGLQLMRMLVEQCWERLRPLIEDGDVEVRAGPFYWLDDSFKGARFPNTVRGMPLVIGKAGQFGLRDWNKAQSAKEQALRDAIEEAVRATPAEPLQALAEDIDQSSAELSALLQSLRDKMGQAAPGLVELQQAVGGCQKLVHDILKKKVPTAAATGTAGPNGAVGQTMQPVTSREDAYRKMAEAADVLRHLEPHSPIPYIVQRAVELGRMPFPQMIKALGGGAGLADLLDKLGIKDESASS